MASLFSACKDIMLYTKQSGEYNISDNNVSIEYYTQEAITSASTIGDSDESKIVLFADKTITIPRDYTLTPASPKKSLVFYCDTLVNNGTISMYQKAPNTLPHDYFIIGVSDGYTENVIVPAYANNAKISNIKRNTGGTTPSEHNGNNGTNRNCGSGGLGSCCTDRKKEYIQTYGAKSGSGYAFGGGAGSGGIFINDMITDTDIAKISPNATYPMRAGNGIKVAGSGYYVSGGVGNPKGTNSTNGNYGVPTDNAFGCGGRIIIFCNNFENNGTITVNGTTNLGIGNNSYDGLGGSSGAGAIDIFYKNKIQEGILEANGGGGGTTLTKAVDIADNATYVGAGGNGSITLSELQSNILMKPLVKYFSSANVDYLLSQLALRIKDSRTGE